MCSVLVVSVAVLLASSVGSQEATVQRDEMPSRGYDGGRLAQELSVPVDDTTMHIFRKIQDLELLQRNIEECYQAETHTLTVACLARQSLRHSAELDGELVTRVFEHLAGTPEHKRFLTAYGSLTRDPDHRLRHAAQLYDAYISLLHSGRLRLINQLKERQEHFSPDNFPRPASQGGSVRAPSGRTAALAQSNYSEMAAKSPVDSGPQKQDPQIPEWLRTFSW